MCGSLRGSWPGTSQSYAHVKLPPVAASLSLVSSPLVLAAPPLPPPHVTLLPEASKPGRRASDMVPRTPHYGRRSSCRRVALASTPASRAPTAWLAWHESARVARASRTSRRTGPQARRGQASGAARLPKTPRAQPPRPPAQPLPSRFNHSCSDGASGDIRGRTAGRIAVDTETCATVMLTRARTSRARSAVGSQSCSLQACVWPATGQRADVHQPRRPNGTMPSLTRGVFEHVS